MSTHVDNLTVYNLDAARLEARVACHAVTLCVDSTRQIATVHPSGRITVRNER